MTTAVPDAGMQGKEGMSSATFCSSVPPRDQFQF